jgi:methyl-accepting chemotaxis protein
MSTDRQSFSVLDQFLYGCGTVATWIERATPTFLRRRFGLRVFLAGPVMSLIVVPIVGVYLIADPLLSVLAIGGGVAMTGFLVYAEMYWLLRNMNEQVLTVEAGEYDLSFAHGRRDNIGDIFDTFESVAADLGDSIAEAEHARETAEAEAQKARAAEREAARREEDLQASVETMLGAIDRFADGDLTVRLDPAPEQDDEIRRLFEGFNRAAQSVRQILLDVRAAADETAATTRQISASSDEMAASAEEQSTQSEEVAAAVEELNQTISENARSVQQTAEAAATGGRRARHGQEVVAKTTEKIEEMATRRSAPPRPSSGSGPPAKKSGRSSRRSTKLRSRPICWH